MTKHAVLLIAVSTLATALSSCMIRHHGDDCDQDPAFCDAGPSLSCSFDRDCGAGWICSRNVCIASTTCGPGRTCPFGLRCDEARLTCTPGTGGTGTSGTGGVSGAGGAITGGHSGAAGGAGRGGLSGTAGAGAGNVVGSGGAGVSSGGGAGSAGSGAATGTAGTQGGTAGAGGATMCVRNADCPTTNCCVSGSCQPRPDTGTPLCRFNSECGTTGRCRDGACEPACSVAADCGTGDICVGGYCRENPASGGACIYNADCGAAGPGAACVNGTCHPACQADTQCGSRDRCQAGLCLPDRRPRPGCRANADCGGAQICVNAVCRTECASNADCCNCGAASVCHGGLCVTPGEAAPQCRVTKECGALQSCIDAVCSL